MNKLSVLLYIDGLDFGVKVEDICIYINHLVSGNILKKSSKGGNPNSLIL